MDYLPAVKVQLKVTRHSSAQYLKSSSKNPQPFCTLWEPSVYGVPVSNCISPGAEISRSPTRGQSLCWQRAGTSVLWGQAPGNSWDHKRCLKTAILLAMWVVLNRVPTPSEKWRVPKLVPGRHALSRGSLSFSTPPSWNKESTNLVILQVFSLGASLLFFPHSGSKPKRLLLL